MEKYDIKRIRELITKEQIKKVLESLGANPVETDKGLILETICHNHIGHSKGKKLYYYDNTKMFRCYTECEGTFDIFELIRKVDLVRDDSDTPLPAAIEKVMTMLNLERDGVRTNTDKVSDLEDEIDLLQFYLNLNEEKPPIPMIDKEFEGSILNNLSFVAPLPWLKEGITIETMKKYNIRYYGSQHKIVIPHYSHTGKLVGIRFRAMIQDDILRFGKYGPLTLSGVMYNHPIGQNLYGLNLNLENIKRMKKIIIFESEKSVLLYDSFFGSENNISVAVCGSSISLVQLEIIKIFIPEVEEIIIAFDKQFKERGDEEFKKHTKNLVSITKKISRKYLVSIVFDKENKLNYKDSPIDRGKEVFEGLFLSRLLQNT